MRTRRQLHCAALSAGLGTALLMTAGCQSGQATSLNRSPSPARTESPKDSASSAPIPSPPAASKEQAILAQYRKFFELQTPLIQAPAAQRPAIFAEVAVDPSYSRTLEGVAAAEAAGETFYGELTLNPVIVSVDDRTARLRDCQDASRTGRMKKATGTKVTVGRKADQLLATMVRGDDGVWRMSHAQYQAEPC